jgi:hypothetical protein
MKLKATINPDYFDAGDGVHVSRFSQLYIDYVAAGNIVDPVDPLPLDVQNLPVLEAIKAAESATLRAIREYILGDASAVARLRTADDNIKL